MAKYLYPHYNQKNKKITVKSKSPMVNEMVDKKQFLNSNARNLENSRNNSLIKGIIKCKLSRLNL